MDVPDFVDVTYEGEWFTKKRFMYDVAIINRNIDKIEFQFILKMLRAYTVFFTDSVDFSGINADIIERKCASIIRKENLQEFLSNEVEWFFPGGYGEKYKLDNFSISNDFKGEVFWNGGSSIKLNGFYGGAFSQVTYSRGNIPLMNGKAVSFWLEYRKEDSVEIELHITQFAPGAIDTVVRQWIFSEEDLNEEIIVQNKEIDGPIFVSIFAKGEGELEIFGLHDRWTRGKYGAFFPGGERTVTSDRQEIFSYFDPGDLKPPLCVYFSGYKTAEGFEGYYMMRSLGCPMLLITESRLEGGAFYMGSDEYENLLVKIISDCAKRLGFSSDEIVLSGLSMGTFGALYYGCDIKPHAILLGKPLASIGNVAKNEKHDRPGGFPTSLDVLKFTQGSIDEEAINNLNKRMWKKFENTNFSKTKFIMSYMIEDDYDMDAYNQIIAHLKDSGVKAYGKGIHGRHNDATAPIVEWFVGQYRKVIKEDFNR